MVTTTSILLHTSPVIMGSISNKFGNSESLLIHITKIVALQALTYYSYMVTSKIKDSNSKRKKYEKIAKFNQSVWSYALIINLKSADIISPLKPFISNIIIIPLEMIITTILKTNVKSLTIPQDQVTPSYVYQQFKLNMAQEMIKITLYIGFKSYIGESTYSIYIFTFISSFTAQAIGDCIFNNNKDFYRPLQTGIKRLISKITSSYLSENPNLVAKVLEKTTVSFVNDLLTDNILKVPEFIREVNIIINNSV